MSSEPICFSCLPVAGAILSKCLQTAKRKSVRGGGGGREMPLFQHLLGRVQCTDGKALMSVGIKTPALQCIQPVKKCINQNSHYPNISMLEMCL